MSIFTFTMVKNSSIDDILLLINDLKKQSNCVGFSLIETLVFYTKVVCLDVYLDVYL